MDVVATVLVGIVAFEVILRTLNRYAKESRAERRPCTHADSSHRDVRRFCVGVGAATGQQYWPRASLTPCWPRCADAPVAPYKANHNTLSCREERQR
jgi:hypothetical protein